MGVCQSADKRASKKIDNQIRNQRRLNGDTQKLLILGAGESGKSTVLKQIRLLHCRGFSAEERNTRKGAIYSNVVTPMATMVAAMDELNILFKNPALQAEGKLLLGLLKESKTQEPLTEDVVAAVKRLWADAGVQLCYDRRAEYQLTDCAQYFIESIDRIAVGDYTPTDQDMLYSRVPTTGAVQIEFTVDDKHIRVFDVGGQRSERKKWIHCFDDVDVVLFVAAISEYDQKLREDNKTNRLLEAMKLFESVANSQFFANSSVILFLNKTDLFRVKVEEKKIPLAVCFPKFTDNVCSYGAAVAYIDEQFRALRPCGAAAESSPMYVHETCATDTNQAEIVVAAVVDVILGMSMKASGLVQ